MPRILILTANSKTTPLQLASEVQDIRSAVGEHSNFTVRHENEVHGSDFIPLLIKEQPDILHFAGHGGGEQTTISLKSGDKNDVPLSSKDFASILHRLKVRPKLLVLNACSTAEFSNVVRSYVGAFVGASGKIGDAAAQNFSRNFYTNLANSQSVSAAFELAKISANLAGYEGDMLELKSPENSDPEKLIFYGQPELMASFFLSNDGKPTLEKDKTFRLKLWLRGVDQNIESVTYQACHESFKYQYWDILRATSPSFETNFFCHGELIIRAVAWSKDRGTGIESSLLSALERHYGEAPPASIAEMIATVKKP
jgi:hypothetical protein